MKKKLPKFKTDKDAEAFVGQAHLADYDFSSMVPVRFELRRKDAAISLRLPRKLLDVVRVRARRDGIPYQRFIRLAIEKAVEGRQVG